MLSRWITSLKGKLLDARTPTAVFVFGAAATCLVIALCVALWIAPLSSSTSNAGDAGGREEIEGAKSGRYVRRAEGYGSRLTSMALTGYGPRSSVLRMVTGGALTSATFLVDGIDYSDPVGWGMVPLQRIAGREHQKLSPNFRIRDFASGDGAPYARISNRLVDALERLRAKAGSLTIVSGYRHRVYNDQIEVGGVKDSQHIAGRAADVWSGTRTPLQLAKLALEAEGCRIGLGLGPTSLHVDVRGYLASWTYPGAELSEAEFDAWVRRECGLPVSLPDSTSDGPWAPLPVAPDSALWQPLTSVDSTDLNVPVNPPMLNAADSTAQDVDKAARL